MKSTYYFGAIALALTTLLTACADPYEEPLPRRDRLNWPIGLTVHPNGRYLYVVNSNFDTRYREEVGGTLSVIDLETRELLPRNSPYLPSFAGFVKLNGDASRAYVTARHSNAVVAFDVNPSGSAVYCNTGDETTSDPQPCALRRVPDVPGAPRIPSDPYALDVTTVEWTDGAGESFDVDLVNVAHLRGENVTAIAIPRVDGAGPVAAATMQSAALIPGGSAIARRPGTRDMFVGARVSREVVQYFPYLAPEDAALQAIIRRGAVSLGNVGQTVDTRGIAFSADGDTMYVVTRAPDVLHVVDLGPADAETGGGTLRKTTASMVLPRNPSGVFVHDRWDGETLLYIPSFDEEAIVVVDPETLAVTDEIDIGSQPYDFVVDRAQNRCVPGAPCFGYVSLFNDLPTAAGSCQEHNDQPCGSVGIIELDPQSPRYHRLIGKIN